MGAYPAAIGPANEWSLTTEFAPRVNEDNPDPRIACALLLDTSASMQGAPIEELNKGFELFCQEIKDDELAAKRAEIAVITFGGQPQLLVPFTEGRDLQARALNTSGATPLGQALNLALDELEKQKDAYRKAGLEYYRPWLFVLTDGQPTDGETFAAAAAPAPGCGGATGRSQPAMSADSRGLARGGSGTGSTRFGAIAVEVRCWRDFSRC
jgi:hypothetical protein